MLIKEYSLPIDAFVRSIGVSRNIGNSFLLGAGASITSGVKSAYDCIWEWKKEIYLTQNISLEKHFHDVSSHYVRNTIQKWLDEEGIYPSIDSKEEYSFYIEKAYPVPDDRRQFFQNLIQNKQPFVGYHLLCLLAEVEIAKYIWTTNFDGLVSKAAGDKDISLIEINSDSVERIGRPLRRGELLYIALHGDYRYDKLKNTDNELQCQENTLIEALSRLLEMQNLIVIGYSGRDASIMDALGKIYSKKGLGRLYWCGFEEYPSDIVRELIEYAREHNREAFYIPTNGFDDLMIRLAKHCLPEDMKTKYNDIYNDIERSSAEFQPFSMKIDNTNVVIKSNLFPLKCPVEVFQFECDAVKGDKVWRKLREIISGYKISAVPFKDRIYAISTHSEIKRAFGNKIKGTIERTPIDSKELRNRNTHVINLLITTLTKMIADNFKLESDMKDTIWQTRPYKTIIVNSTPFNIHKSANLTIKSFNNNQYFALVPAVKVYAANGNQVPISVVQEIKKDILGAQKNKEFNDDVSFWRKILFEENGEKRHLSLEYPCGSGSGFWFEITRSPIFAKIMKARSKFSERIDESPLYKQEGIEYDEPDLLFCSKDGKRMSRDFHPIRGILENRPYDFPLTQASISSEVSLGVLCPSSHAFKFQSFLNMQNSLIKATTKIDYLFDFPGFQNVYGLPLILPSIESNNWITCSEPKKSENIREVSLNLAKQITENIGIMNTRHQPNVTVIFIPESWERFCGFINETERFDLHNYIKAFSAQRGIATQIIREKTLKAPDLVCQIHWWLSLSFYTKALRTPWILDSIDRNTSFAGIGFSLDHTKKNGNVLMGCSHIYNSQGEGLKYKLSKVENYKIIQDNPYLSKDDAFRFGLSIRQMFFVAMGKMPERVVVHKRTFFTDEEKSGIIEGLGKVKIVDLIEINFESNIRYVASKIKNGKPELDGFPVQRGTCIVLDPSSALLWSHGSAPNAHNRNYRYYLGGHRIPAPLLIKKHFGVSNIGTIATEILGLSKMNWNTFDLYTRLPATVYSSNEIAKVGSLLARHDNKTFDYRFFI